MSVSLDKTRFFPSLFNLKLSGARILARYQAGHVTYQLKISSMYLLLADQSEIKIKIRFCDWSLVGQPQIQGGHFKLNDHVTCPNTLQ